MASRRPAHAANRRGKADQPVIEAPLTCKVSAPMPEPLLLSTGDDSAGHDLAAWVGLQDEAAFHRLVERHRPLVTAVCRRQLGPGDTADEAVQAVFITLARRAGTVSAAGALGSWLYRVALRVCAHARRAAARRKHHEIEAGRMQQESQREEHGDAAMDGSTDWERLRPHLDAALSALKGAQRDALIAHFMEGQPQSVVAARLGISENAAQKRIAYGLEKLRAWFA